MGLDNKAHDATAPGLAHILYGVHDDARGT